MKRAQRGGFILGMIIGLLIGLVIALVVALGVSKVPLPFVNKVPSRTAEQDAAESAKNKSWDPNGPLAGKNARPNAPVASAPGAMPVPASGAGGKEPAPSPAASAASGVSAFIYYVQAGAFGDPDEAEQQRARLAMMGMEARVTQRDQSGRTVYRVRIGPFDERVDADAIKERLGGAGIEGALVRVQK